MYTSIIIKRIENILTNFHEDLGAISTEIQDLQSKSLQMNTRLQNRQVCYCTVMS